jgi:hypothetical protein
MELLDAIKYFAKFPAREGVMKCFSNPENDIEGYAELQSYISSIEGSGIFPEITDFIVSMNEEAIAKRIKSIEGYFMYFEYANIQGTQLDQYRKRETDFKLAIIIGAHYNSRNIDNMVEAIISDKCLSLSLAIAKQMKQDDAIVCGAKRLLDGAFNLAPIPSYMLYQSIGWELSFSKRNNILL